MPRTTAEPPLSPPSLRWLAEADLDSRKHHGQYLTPSPVAEALTDRVRLWPGMRVLDPGVGTGELLAAVARREPGAELHGWDIDAGALAAARELVPSATLEVRSALESPATGRGKSRPGQTPEPEPTEARLPDSEPFDLVIANPPYFQVRVTPELKARFGEVISGRANVFALFFKAGLDLLRPGGTLAYVVPPSMNSGAYFEALREHIVAHASIADLTVLEGSDLFEGANTAAQLLVLEKHGTAPSAPDIAEPGTRVSSGVQGSGFVFERSEPASGFRRVLFSERPERLREGFEGRSTLWQLGYEAVTGTVVWNQRRTELRESAGPGTVPLVWSRNLRGGTLHLEHLKARGAAKGIPPARATRPEPGPGGSGKAKADHIVSRRGLTGPALLVNRVIGAVGRGELRTALVPEGAKFLAENHVNVIRPRSDPAAPDRPRLGWQRLQAAFEAPGTVDRARLLTGNTQISATELTHLVPL